MDWRKNETFGLRSPFWLQISILFGQQSHDFHSYRKIRSDRGKKSCDFTKKSREFMKNIVNQRKLCDFVEDSMWFHGNDVNHVISQRTLWFNANCVILLKICDFTKKYYVLMNIIWFHGNYVISRKKIISSRKYLNFIETFHKKDCDLT